MKGSQCFALFRSGFNPDFEIRDSLSQTNRPAQKMAGRKGEETGGLRFRIPPVRCECIPLLHRFGYGFGHVFVQQHNFDTSIFLSPFRGVVGSDGIVLSTS